MFWMEEAKSSHTPIRAHFKLFATQNNVDCIDTEITYSSAVGSIMYAMVGSMPDLAYEIGLVSCFMSKPGQIHWDAVKWLLRYIKGTKDLQLVYTKDKHLKIQGFCDSDYSVNLD